MTIGHKAYGVLISWQPHLSVQPPLGAIAENDLALMPVYDAFDDRQSQP
jgi:hypothetical protein